LNNSSEIVPKIKRVLDSKNWSLSVAESCTGGLVSARITAVSGASTFFKGSVIAYENYVKKDLLGVDENSLKIRGAVSESVAREMAQGAKEKLRTDWAVSVTGIAGPEGGSPDKPVGTVWFAVIGPGVEHCEKQQFHPGDRNRIQAEAADHVLRLLLNEIEMKMR
jgi:PncC family amidohydrolase